MARMGPFEESRLRLFTFAAAPERGRYVAVLRAFAAAGQRYELQLGPDAVAAELRADDPAVQAEDVIPALDQLVEWGVLARTQDADRVRTLAEYRRRRSIYQLTELGSLAWQAVESVLDARPGEAELQRLVLPAVLEDLAILATANRQGDGERVYNTLSNLHGRLEELARRAGRFYLAMTALSSPQEATAALFLEHKDRLLSHLTDFLGALQALRPRLAAAVAAVEATGVERMIDAVVAADTGPFETIDQKRQRWRDHWRGIAAWFTPIEGQPSRAESLDGRTTRAIRDLAALLRRVADARKGGVSRAVHLEVLARWFAVLPSDDAAHALFSVTFGTRSARHLSLAEADPDAVAGATSWWEAPPVKVETLLRRRGQRGSAGRPAPVRDMREAQQRARSQQTAAREQLRRDQSGLVEARRAARALSDGELALLLRLLDRALSTRRPAMGRVARGDPAAGATLERVRLRLSPAKHDTEVRTAQGTLWLRGLDLDIAEIG